MNADADDGLELSPPGQLLTARYEIKWTHAHGAGDATFKSPDLTAKEPAQAYEVLASAIETCASVLKHHGHSEAARMALNKALASLDE